MLLSSKLVNELLNPDDVAANLRETGPGQLGFPNWQQP